MKPIRLELAGFTAFRERNVVDFDGLGLFAITGQTGAGKTSLLDAMTWALYGKTARGNKGRELISQGGGSVTVLLHFQAGAEEYRVQRMLKSSAGSATVRLEYLDAGREWVALTGNVTELNERVRQIVGLDFDGFNKAVVLPQGEFDRFLRGNPDERRKVLAELLDVRVYQRMMQSANEKASLEAALARQKGLEIDDSATPEAVSMLAQELVQVRSGADGLAASLKKLNAALEEAAGLAALRRQLSDGERELLQTGTKLAAAERRQQDLGREKQALQPRIGQLEARLAEIRYDADEEMRLTAWLPLLDQRAGLLRAIGDGEKKSREAGTRAAAARDRWEAAKKAVAGLDEAWAAEEAELTSTLQKAEQESQAAQQHYEHLHQLDRVSGLRSELAPGHPCPVCEQTVATVPPVVDGKALAAAKKAAEKKTAAFESARTRLEKARKQATTDRETALTAERSAAEALSRADAAVEVSEATLEQSRNQLEDLEQKLEGAPDLEATRARVEELRTARTERDRIAADLESVRRKLAENDVLSAAARAEADTLRAQTEARAGANAELENQIGKAAAKLGKQLPELPSGGESEWIRARQTKAQGELEAARQRMAQIESDIRALREKADRNERLRTEIAAHEREQAQYRDLAQWLNAGNFQQFLLDSALQRLADEGSRHLQTLSGQRYTFVWRDKEFYVRDAWHGGDTRSVSTLSGGESFLASLSLALALAEGIAELNSESGRVLLESLFLDEGFSTLDSETLRTVADALMLLRSDNRLIGIITHVEGLAEEMPGRIEVEKTVAGSRIRSMRSSVAL